MIFWQKLGPRVSKHHTTRLRNAHDHKYIKAQLAKLLLAKKTGNWLKWHTIYASRNQPTLKAIIEKRNV